MLKRGSMQDENSSSRPEVFTMSPIGLIHTPFQHATGTPIQSAVAPNSEGVVELFPEFTPGLRDLEGFERLWLIYLLNRASTPQLLARPYLDDQVHGIFATRAPARPILACLLFVFLAWSRIVCLSPRWICWTARPYWTSSPTFPLSIALR